MSTPQLVRLIEQELARVLEVDPATIRPDVPFDNFGLDSAAAVDLIGVLSKHLERPLDPTLPYQYDTILKLADHLAEGEDR